MTSIPTTHALILASALFLIGAVGIVARRNLLFVLMSIEIMLSATGIAFVAAAARWGQADGQVVVIFIFVTAAAEVAVGLSLLLAVFGQGKTVDSDKISTMKG
jgi:NADH-quinone oxidoreductase subunit K